MDSKEEVVSMTPLGIVCQSNNDCNSCLVGGEPYEYRQAKFHDVATSLERKAH